MTTIHTTTECLTVKESYETVKGMLKYKILELTQVRIFYSEYLGPFEEKTTEKVILLMRRYIIKLEPSEL